MLSRRPLLYLTIPSLALLIGLWFRRKKAIAGAASSDSNAKQATETTTKSGATEHQQVDRIRGRRDISESVPIGSGSDDDGSLLNTSGCSSTNSDKGVGAIQSSGPNSRSPPIPIANKPGCGGHTSDELNSVDEFDVESSVSPVDLPGSYERRNFEFVKNSHLYNKRTKGSMDVPIKVITASKSPKISPKNAFSEATGTSTPATKKQQKQQQQTPKSPAAEQQQNEDSLIIRGQMAKLSLDDSVTHSSSVETKPTTTTSSATGTASSAQETESNNTTTSTTPQGAEQPQQALPPTANSPPLSLYSVHSNDSGKGSSPIQSEAATAAGGDLSQGNCFEFLVHEKYVGLLIGRGGMTVKKLHKRFGVHMIVRRVPNCPRPTDRVCAIMGAPTDIEAALAFIRNRTPEDRYPDLSLERVHYASRPVTALGIKESVVFAPQSEVESSTPATQPKAAEKPVMPIHYPVAQLPLSLSLVEGINNDVVISTILNGGHVFLQQQSHPTFQQLQALHKAMAMSYGAQDSPLLEVLEKDSVCVAPVAGVWYRVVIENSHVSEEGIPMCLVKFLDFGGFVTVLASELRQIRSDFMALPFQSIECVLSNLRPIGGGEWAQEAGDFVLQFGSGRVLQAQVAGYTDEGLPEVLLYAILGPDNVSFINQELVAQGFADWIEDSDDVEAESAGVVVDQQQ